MNPTATRSALRAIATFEAIKGLLALAALIGLLDLLHHDVRRLAIELIGRFGLNPSARYPSMLLHYADLIPGTNVHMIVLLGSAYIAVRLLEAYGLWNALLWGEWLGTLSTGLYVPFELAHLLRRPSAFGALVVAGNIALVIFLARQLWAWREHRAERLR